jgi:hypothetical protein
MATANVVLTPELIEGFAGVFLSPMYDNPQPTPDFHRLGWELYCSPWELCSIVAPREHAKSTAFTHDYVLAEMLFRTEIFAIIVSATEELAKDHLADIAKVLREDDEIKKHFGVIGLVTDAKTEIVCRHKDGHEFRILARGAGQKMRGLKWKGRRPGLIVCDDLEEDEQVENPDRRVKFRKWFNRALLPCRRRGGRVRLHGTILHEDALLARVQRNSQWRCQFYRAHASFDDFTEILWPEQFPESRLRAIRQNFIDDGDAPGYSQEYLNDPLDQSVTYLKSDWFVPMSENDRPRHKLICAAADFAISKADKANRTSLTVGGMDSDNILHFIDQHVDRWDSLEIIEEIFSIRRRWNPDVFWVESGQIWLSLRPQIVKEMQRRSLWINFVERVPIKDKASRGRSLQRRMRASGTRWDTAAHWFEGMRQEMLRFTGESDATLDDQFDSAALLSLGFDGLADVEEEDFTSDEEWRFRAADPRLEDGRNQVTGY